MTRNKYGTLTLADGSTYTGNFKNDKFHGLGRMETNRDLIIEGKFENGQNPVWGTLRFPNGTIFEGMIIDNGIGEKGKLTTPKGEIYEGFFKNGVR